MKTQLLHDRIFERTLDKRITEKQNISNYFLCAENSNFHGFKIMPANVKCFRDFGVFMVYFRSVIRQLSM